MPHSTIRLLPSVNEVETQALNNDGGISSSNLIRFKGNPGDLGLVEKLGGFTKFVNTPTPAITRALVAWEDLNATKHLGFGTQAIGNTSSAELGVITNGQIINITPESKTEDLSPVANTTQGSSLVIITDGNTTATNYDSVFIQTHIAVDGLVLYGQYQTIQDSSSQYQIQAVDTLGNPLSATSTAGNATLANYTTTTGSNNITVTLANHGYSVGSTYPALVPTTIANVTVYGNYFVTSVGNTSTFNILAATQATGNTSGLVNAGQAQFIYSFGIGAVPPGSGYGRGGYGSGGYGTGTNITPTLGTAINATDWTMDNWGEIMLACPINGTLFQPIYEWDPTSGNPIATVIPQAPTVNDGILVAMPQRQIVAWGSTATGIQDPLLINWCDVNNFNQWIATVTNQAGSYRIPRGSKIVGCLQAANQILIWTDIDVWSMQYVGPPDIYSFNEIGAGCGLIARKAAATYNGATYWMGQNQFYSLTPSSAVAAGGVGPIPCPIWDVIFQDLDMGNLTKIRAGVNSRFSEVEWFYPTTSSGGEVSNYVKYNVALNEWDYGTLGRSAWIDQSVLGPPIGADPSSMYLYQHETSPDADGQPLIPIFQTGYYTLGDGDQLTFVDQIWPDAKWAYFGQSGNATIQMTLLGADYPGQTPVSYGPYLLTQSSTFVTPRFRHRLLAFQFTSTDVGTWWRLGAVRYRWSPAGRF